MNFWQARGRNRTFRAAFLQQPQCSFILQIHGCSDITANKIKSTLPESWTKLSNLYQM